MSVPRKSRGEYRPIYEALFTGKDFRQLSPDSKLVLLTLKGLCGAIGIKVWPALHESLAELTGISQTRIKKAVAHLIERAWMQHEDGIVWVVRGLAFEPQVSTGEKHKKWIINELASFPRSPIVERFREEYAVFFGPTEDTPSIPYRRAIDNPCDTTTPSPTLTPTPSLSPSPASSDPHRDVQLLARAANRGIAERYGEQPVPIIASSGSSHQCVEALRAAGVDVDFAAAVILAYASTMAKEQPPRSLNYFTRHVVERWQAEEAKREAATYQPTAVPSAPEVDQLRAFAIRYANEGSLEWQTYCDDLAIDWKAAA